jgi:hypothetical protein
MRVVNWAVFAVNWTEFAVDWAVFINRVASVGTADAVCVAVVVRAGSSKRAANTAHANAATAHTPHMPRRIKADISKRTFQFAVNSPLRSSAITQSPASESAR